jgi:hypothetical protein
MIDDNVEEFDDINKLCRPVEKCTKDGKHQTVSRLIAQPGSTIRPKRQVFDLDSDHNYHNYNHITDTPMSINKLNREYDNLGYGQTMSDEKSNDYSNSNKKSSYETDHRGSGSKRSNAGHERDRDRDRDGDLCHDLDSKLASIDNIISNCHGMIGNRTDLRKELPKGPNEVKARHQRDLDDELSDVDELELTKSLRESYNGQTHTSAS